MTITRTALFIAALFAVAVSAFGQDRKSLSASEQSQYVVSARAGAVNIVDGDASFKRGRSDWESLISGDELRTGDAVKTEADGRVEVLLNPGSFLRLSENSEFIFSSTSIYNLRLKLTRGSAIVEASAVDAPMFVTAGQTLFSIVGDGLYRFGVDADGKALAVVRKGKILYAGNVVKDGKKIEVVGGGSAPLITGFDKKIEDSFDTWSKDRARTIVAANKKLSSREMMRNLSFGWGENLWLYNPYLRCYTFLPFGSGYNSPYGWGYRVCNPYYNSWRNNSGGTVAGGSHGSGGGNTGSSGGSGGSGGSAPSAPSYPIGGSNSGGGDRAAPPSRSGAEVTSRGRRID